MGHYILHTVLRNSQSPLNRHKKTNERVGHHGSHTPNLEIPQINTKRFAPQIFLS
jgi:hypothetical protein